MQHKILNDGKSMPQLGFGLWQVTDLETERSVLEAFRTGYRSIDSATIYGNEAGLGRAIRKSELPREDLFITTKLWNVDHGFDTTLRAFDGSLSRLGLREVDLYLIHYPAPKQGKFIETWKALVQLRKEGRAKSIGVSNFRISDLEKIMDATGEKPALNQIELHPWFQQRALQQFHDKHQIATESWSPLGQGQVLEDPVIVAIAAKHRKTAAQTVLRWHMQSNLITIPKTVTASRIKENLAVFDFKLDDEDMAQILKLDRENGRIGPNPETADF